LLLVGYAVLLVALALWLWSSTDDSSSSAETVDAAVTAPA
jgi:hypothetical protein